jgi:transcriptional regulator with XRE-family HTH domain
VGIIITDFRYVKHFIGIPLLFFMMEFKEIIKEIYTETGLTQIKFAEILGIRQGHLSEWLRGVSSPSFEHLQNICEKLNISGDRILGLKE